jgi:hypothetical protein
MERDHFMTNWGFMWHWLRVQKLSSKTCVLTTLSLMKRTMKQWTFEKIERNSVFNRLCYQARNYVGKKIIFRCSYTAVRDLHVFCDASHRAYGKVTYLVHQGEVSFFQSKARITPFKSQKKEENKELSIPASELMAAYLGIVIATIIIAAPKPLEIKLQVYL